MGFQGGWELVIIFIVIILLFGAKRLPELAKGLGKGIREFRKAAKDVQEEITMEKIDEPESKPEPPADDSESQG